MLIPTRVGERVLLAMNSIFRRPDWRWPKEELVAGPIPNYVLIDSISAVDKIIQIENRITWEEYKHCEVGYDVAVLRNAPYEITTPAGGWIALNPTIGKHLGWRLSDKGIFSWVNASDEIMVESIWWRDGWTEMRPPHSFHTLGEGWLILCSPDAYRAVVSQINSSRMVIGVRRESTVEDSEGDSRKIEHWMLTEREL
ncbi:MAG TPA: hypothetical protein VFA07_09420 [Chthonomonadaceae bacterium]|nr:hypothetical protein [Chthonomonadaceae bacterium]